MLKTEERRIGEHEYRVRQMPGREALAMFTTLTKTVGPAVAALAGGKGASVKSLLDQEVATLAQALTTLCDDLDPGRVQSVARDFAAHSQLRLNLNGTDTWQPLSNEAVFDDAFAGRIDELLGWLAFCVEVNFRGFLSASRKLVVPASAAQQG